MKTRLASAALVAALALAGCGGDDGPTPEERAEASASAEAKASASASAQAAVEKAVEAEATRKRKQARYEKCSTGIGGFLSSLQELDSRLSIGMNNSDYGDRVGDIQVEYDKFTKIAAAMPRPCIMRVGIPAENAFNEYITVNNIWDECITDYSCDFSEGDTNTKVQKAWAKAGRLIEKADTARHGLAP